MKNKRNDLIIALLPLVLLPVGITGLHFYDVRFRGAPLPCPFRALLGIYCPGCGGTHCIYALAGGHIVQAVRYNLFAVLIVVFLLLLWLERVLALFGCRKKLIPASRAFWLAVTGIIIAYLVLRNLIPALAPF
ncbi:MAG: DUF2752 domain-containing protein [Ruminococcus sp.]|nr:DUF2752 domain-containing protein [Ruminococcus sp.]